MRNVRLNWDESALSVPSVFTWTDSKSRANLLPRHNDGTCNRYDQKHLVRIMKIHVDNRHKNIN